MKLFYFITSISTNFYILGCEKQAFWTSGSLKSWPANNNPNAAVFNWLITGEQFSYTNWCFSQPNQFAGNVQYVVTYNGCWYGTAPDSNQYYICEGIDPEYNAPVKVKESDPNAFLRFLKF